MEKKIERDHKIMNVYDSISRENLTRLLNKGYKIVSSTPLEGGSVQYVIMAEYWKEVHDPVSIEKFRELMRKIKEDHENKKTP